MRGNITRIYFSHKSGTCISRNGTPLSVYNSFSEAQESADFQFSRNRIQLIPYSCPVCGKFHLKPEEFYCKKIISRCSCTDHNGHRKDCYATRKDAEKMVSIRSKTGITLYVYPCPQGNGFHLTSRKGYWVDKI